MLEFGCCESFKTIGGFPSFGLASLTNYFRVMSYIRVYRLTVGFIAAGLFASWFYSTAQRVPVIDKELANGMHLLMVERHDEPSVAGGWVAHVGSSNEKPGMTGTAHLFEHMMFKGTPTIGTKDYQKDLKIMEEQERLRDQMREEERKMRAMYRRGEIDDPLKPENRTERYKELEKKFNEQIGRE